MPRTVDDIEQDSAPDIRVARRALNSTLQDNTKIDRVSDEVKDDQSNKRTDDDGKHNRDKGDSSKNPDSVFNRGGNNTSGSGGSSDDENIGNFIRDLFGDTKEEDEEIIKDDESNAGGSSGSGNQQTNTSGGSQSGNVNPQERGPTDKELDSEPTNTSGGSNVSSNRTGNFGNTSSSEEEGESNNTSNDEELSSSEEQEILERAKAMREAELGKPKTDDEKRMAAALERVPFIVRERRNLTKPLYIEFNGIRYPIDRKGTVVENPNDIRPSDWHDDTFRVGSTEFTVGQFVRLISPEYQIKLFEDALKKYEAEVDPKNRFSAISAIAALVSKTDSKYGAVVQITYQKAGSEQTARFDDTGHIKIDGKTYSARQVFLTSINTSVLDWLKKEANSPVAIEEVKSVYRGWGFPDIPPPVEDGNPATNPDDPEKKLEPKLKENASPEGAPPNVENSAALTTAKLRELNGKIVAPGASINMWASHIDYKVPKYPTSLGYYGIRDQKSSTDGLGFAKDEYNTETKLIGAVKVHFNAQWEKLITGTPFPVAKNSEDLNLIDYPIIMNFTEVGVWNKKVPYVADTQTEQHRMLYKGYSGGRYNMDKWGIGSFGAGENKGGFANWAEQPHWCGIFTQHCISHGGYTFPGEPVGLAAANKINDVYFNSSLKKLKDLGIDNATESFANVPTYLDSSGKSIPVKTFLDKKGFGVKGGKSDYFTNVYGILLENATYSETTETEVVMVPDGKKLKPKTKTKVNKEKIPIAVRESLLPNPIMIYFIAGIHFTKDGLTPQGKKLLEHFLSQRGWEVSIISRGGHIEVCPYINPDGTIARFGGNTGATSFVSRDGGKFAAKSSSIWAFSGGAKAGTFVVFTKVIPKAGSQKIEPTMNGVFRRTPIVDSYYRSINNTTILPTLKNVLYDQIVEKE
jgi:hypothetical protein